jgi:hypothetical protein
VRNREEKIDKNFVEKIFSRENSCEKWRKTFLEKNIVKNGENYMVDTNTQLQAPKIVIIGDWQRRSSRSKVI